MGGIFEMIYALIVTAISSLPIMPFKFIAPRVDI
jgi:hypothetical protein